MLLLALAVGVGLGGEAGAQPIPREQLTVRETIDVRVVHLDAVVTDRSSQPMLDLEPSDFDLRVDGQRVEITDVSEGRELTETVAGRLTVVLFIDDRHLRKSDRDPALLEIGEALAGEMRRHSTWVAVTRYGNELSSLLPPTRDVEALQVAVREAMETSPEDSESLRTLRLNTAREVRDMFRGLARYGTAYRNSQATMTAVGRRVRTYGEALANDTRKTLAGVESLVEALAFVPGRKAVLLLSDGLSREPLDLLSETVFDRLIGGSSVFEGDDPVGDRSESLTTNDTNRRPTGSELADTSGIRTVQQGDGGAAIFQTITELSLGADFDRLAALANTSRVTFYPLRPPVLDARLSALGEQENNSISALSDRDSGLESLADLTGGLAFAAGGGIGDFVQRTSADASTYYSISFTPPETMWNSGIRELELKVRRRKSRIRYRASYVPVTMEQSLASRAWGTLLFDWQENVHGLAVQATVGGTQEAGAPVEILARLPIAELVLAPDGKILSGAYRLVVQLRDDNGARMRPLHYPFSVTIPRREIEVARGQLFEVRTSLDVPSGLWDMAVGLWEENTGRSSFVTLQMEVGSRAVPPVAALVPAASSAATRRLDAG